MKKHRALKVILIFLAVLLIITVAGGWWMFGTQLKAAGTIERLEDHLYALEYRGDYGFDDFLSQGGASSDAQMADYIASFLSHGFWKPDASALPSPDFGCSTITVKDADGNMIFGRNYDWADCDAMIVHTVPENGYESVSTCCLDFLGFGEGWKPEGMMDKFLALAAVYIPLDGMNERGLCVADLMAGDETETHQDTSKPDLTITSAIRLLLDQAATVDEAIDLLSRYDMNSSIGTAHHLSIADATGRCVVVEYIDGEMFVTEAPIVTNHYLTEGEKYGIGSAQSHLRYDTLSKRYAESGGVMSLEAVRNCLESVSQGNFPGSDELTQWSIVYVPSALTADFYFRENYQREYSAMLLDKSGWLFQ